jgi:hypothetical protein
MYAGLCKRFVHTGLIGPERTAILQHKGHAFKGKVSLVVNMRLDLDVHGGVSFSDQWPMETGPPSLTLRRVSASGTAASEISINTQKASM